jgi:hypothetical protein
MTAELCKPAKLSRWTAIRDSRFANPEGGEVMSEIPRLTQYSHGSG